MCCLGFLLVVALAVIGNLVYGLPGIPGGLVAGIIVCYVYSASWNWYVYKAGRHPLQWLRARLGGGLGVEELARRLKLNAAELRGFQPQYREVLIPKKRGGQRRLMVPDEATKALQRCILRRLLSKLRVHPAAYGFVKGRSAIDNACRHAGQAVVLTMDVIDFFPSTKAERIEAYFRRVGWNAAAAALLTRLTTHEGGLPQGAPTSPALSNLVNFYADAQITKAVGRYKGTYTRYADDIAVSFSLDYPKQLRKVTQRIRRILARSGYHLHALRKLRVCRQHQRQVVTGLVVNAKANLPRKTRRWLRAVAHRLSTGKQATLTPEQLQGWLAYRHAVETASKESQPPPFDAAKNRKVIRRRKRYRERWKNPEKDGGA